MNPQLITAGLVGFGLLLAFAGLALFRKALTMFGAMLGGIVGFSAMTVTSEGEVLYTVVGVVIGVVVGILLVHTLYRLIVVTPGFLIGAAVGSSIDGSIAVIIGLGIAGAIVAWYIETAAVIGATSIGGGMLVSAALTASDPTTPATLLDARLVTIWTGAIAIAGIAVQYGIVKPFSDDSTKKGSSRDGTMG